VPADAVQNKINNLLRLSQPLVAKDVMAHGKRDGPQHAGNIQRVQPQLILIWFDQRCDGNIEQLILSLLLGPKAVPIRRLLTQSQQPKQRDDPTQPLLEDDNRGNQPLLEGQPKIDFCKLIAGALNVVGILDDCVNQSLLGRKGAEDRTLRDAGSFGNLPRTDVTAKAFQEWLGSRDERSAALIQWQRRGASHAPSLVSECSLSNGLSRSFISLSDTSAACQNARECAVDLGRLTDEVFEAVIFDLDGTLIDSTPAVVRAWATWTSEYGLAPIDLNKYHGTPSASTVRAVMPEHLHESGMRRITELELADLHDIVVLPGATEALASLANSKNAIATSCTVPLAEARITAARLEPPTVLVTADDVVNGKPHPEPFLQAARRLGADPRRCLVVEDAPKGLQAAQAAGCFTLAVVTTTPREALHADAIVTDLSKVRFEASDEGIRVSLVDQSDAS
jgi:mannitol-1-/sugar-/sorbitol-6-phosphatase